MRVFKCPLLLSSMMATFIITFSIFVPLSTAFAQGIGTVEVGADASEWSSATVLSPPTIFPVGGSGQLNGEFTIVQRDGVEIGLRATDRTDGLLTATGKRKGVYMASTGFDNPPTNTRAEWNYDIHIDLRGSGTALGDYDLTLIQTFVRKLGGSAGPFDLTFSDAFPGLLAQATLYQQSFNPVFFNDTFDVNAEGTYNLVLTLKPKAGGPPLKAHIQVIVSAP